MRYLASFRFQTKIILGIAAIMVILAMVMAPLVARMTTDALVAELRKRGSALAQGLALRVVDPMLAADPLRLKNMVDQVAGLGGEVVYAFILDADGNLVAHTFNDGFPVDLLAANPVGGDGAPHIQLLDDGTRLIDDFAAPVMVAGSDFGTARIGLSRERIQAEVTRLLWTMVWFSAAALALAIGMATVFAQRVTRRIGQLREHAEEIVKGNLDLQAAPKLARNCWEIMGCDKEHCPAYGDTRRRCWYMAGTLCPTCDDGAYPAKHSSCKKCRVYTENVGDEIQDLAETFDVMAITLKQHLDELRSAERVLSEQQDLLRTVLDATPDLVSLVDTRMVYKATNKAFADFVGKSPAQIEAATDFDLFPEDLAEKRNMEGRDILQSGTGIDKEMPVIVHGERRWFHVVAIPVRDRDGRIIGLLRTDRDITALKNYQTQLIQAQKMESLGKLAGGVAHEINTPLGVILGYAQLLLDDVQPDSQIAEDLATIEKQAQVCKKIVADLLGFSRQQESSKLEMCFNNSVMEAVQLVQHSFGMDGVRIEPRLDDRMPIIYGDPDKLKQVWVNLLNNASDAMEDGGAIVVETRLDSPNRTIVLRVVDSGKGITKGDMERIFDPFFTTKPVGKGTGLGLSVSFGIVEDHGGRIRCQSPAPGGYSGGDKAGPGTMFEVELPLDHGSGD